VLHVILYPVIALDFDEASMDFAFQEPELAEVIAGSRPGISLTGV
jgi:hypothetical protein